MMRVVLLVMLFAIATSVSAHKASDSYLTLDVREKAIDARWDIALRDLEYALGLDASADGNITWGEVRRKSGEIQAFALAGLRLSRGGENCRPIAGQQLIDTHSDGAYVVLPVRFECAGDADVLRADYRLLFDVDPTHRGLVNVTQGERSLPLVFSPEKTSYTLNLSHVDLWESLYGYLTVGVHHILIGLDHILFLLSLLLAVTLTSVRDRPASNTRSVFFALIKTVTAFSVAHSLTLCLGFFEVVNLPQKWVEAGIAVSVIVVAINNVIRIVPVSEWVMAFCFGLVHGLGFAGILSELSLPASSRVYALAAFNIGVELGQLLIVIPLLLLIFPIRDTAFYRGIAVRAGSVSIGLIGLMWLFERVFDVSFY
jgi:hydrogenase/urease accessory protein HupE